MRRLITTLVFMMLLLTASSQNREDTIKVVKTIDEVGSFKLFPTTNIWTFLKLDTRNGRIWQVQWSFEDTKRFESTLSEIPLVFIDEEVNGRFTLYPTTNNYNFIMLDQISGQTYQVQWSLEPEKRGILLIEK